MDQDKFKQYFQKDATEAQIHTHKTQEEINDLKTYNQKARIIRQQARVAFARSAEAAREFILIR